MQTTSSVWTADFLKDDTINELRLKLKDKSTSKIKSSCKAFRKSFGLFYEFWKILVEIYSFWTATYLVKFQVKKKYPHKSFALSPLRLRVSVLQKQISMKASPWTTIMKVSKAEAEDIFSKTLIYELKVSMITGDRLIEKFHDQTNRSHVHEFSPRASKATNPW